MKAKVKLFISIVGILIGITLFRYGYNLFDQKKSDKIVSISETAFWENTIVLKSGKDLKITPHFLFKTMPPLETYPADNRVYFKYINSRNIGSKIIVTGTVIQNGETLFKNQYYFVRGEINTLLKIINEDIITGDIREITKPEEIVSLIEIYVDFIELWTLI